MTTMQGIYVLMLLTLGMLCFKVQGQHIQNQFFDQKPGVNIKISPLNMLEAFYHTIEGAIEYKFHPKYSLQFQFGYGNSDITFHRRLYRDIEESAFETFRTRVEFRKYTLIPLAEKILGLKYPKKHCPYWAIEALWRNTTFFDEDLLGRSCRNGFCDYQEIAPFRRVKNIGVVYFKIGNQQYLGRHFLIDFYMGLGLRFIHVAAPDEDPEAFIPNQVLVDPREPKQLLLPGLAFGVKVGYAIN